MSVDRYYVIWPDGQQFGPADVQTLQRWAVENRIGPATILRHEHSGQQIQAAQVPQIHAVLPFSANLQQAYNRPAPIYDPGNETKIAWVLGAVGLCCFGMISGTVGIVMAGIGIQKKQPGAVGALIFNIIVVILSVFGIAAMTMFRERL